MTKSANTATETAAFENTACAKKLAALRQSTIKRQQVREEYAGAMGAESGKWPHLLKVAATIGIMPEDWRGSDKQRRYLEKVIVSGRDGLLDQVLPEKYNAGSLETYGRVMKGEVKDGDNLSPVQAKSLYGVTHQRRAELRGIVSFFGAPEVQHEVSRGWDQYREVAPKSGAANVFYGKMLTAARAYMERAEPSREGLCGRLAAEVETMIRELGEKKPEASTMETVNKARADIGKLLRKLSSVEDGKYLPRAMAGAVETIINNHDDDADFDGALETLEQFLPKGPVKAKPAPVKAAPTKVEKKEKAEKALAAGERTAAKVAAREKAEKVKLPANKAEGEATPHATVKAKAPRIKVAIDDEVTAALDS